MVRHLQSFQEKMYQEQMAVKALEKAGQLEVYYEQTLARINAELSSILSQHYSYLATLILQQIIVT